MLAFAAMLLTQCKDDGSSPLFDAIIAPQVSLNFTSENSTLEFDDIVTTDDSSNPTYIDLNHNFQKDPGEEIVANKQYQINDKKVTLYGHIEAFQLTDQFKLVGVTVQSRYLKKLEVVDCRNLAEVQINKANTLELIDLTGCNAVEKFELTTNGNFISALKEIRMGNPLVITKEDFIKKFLNNLPKRNNDGKLYIDSTSFTTEMAKIIVEKGWELNP